MENLLLLAHPAATRNIAETVVSASDMRTLYCIGIGHHLEMLVKGIATTGSMLKTSAVRGARMNTPLSTVLGIMISW
ncbi:hypothetical protein D1872_281550 [compost metagenome]